MLFTAVSYAKMSAAFPSAGSNYTYADRALNQHIGFLAGWAMILDYLLIPLVSIIYAGLTAARLVPQVPYLAWCILFTVCITGINLVGIRGTALAGGYMMWIMSACAVLFFVLAAKAVIAANGFPGLFSSLGVYRPQDFALRPLMLGAGIATLSYIGFDAISTLAEDTIHPARDISFATITVCLVQTVICFLTVYLAALAWPDYRTFPETETAILDIGQKIGGPWMLGLLTVVLLVAGLASALAGQAGASRLLYGMGRDGVLPSRIFAHIDPRFSSPTRSVLLLGILSLAGTVFFRFQMAVELLNFGALAGFILVNLSVIRHYYVRLRQRRGAAVITSLIFPALGALVCGYVWLSLTLNARLTGFAWLGIGVLYLAVLTKGFRIAPKRLNLEPVIE